jgi:hypothetical protein
MQIDREEILIPETILHWVACYADIVLPTGEQIISMPIRAKTSHPPALVRMASNHGRKGLSSSLLTDFLISIGRVVPADEARKL